jgi:hypothetical protein
MRLGRLWCRESRGRNSRSVRVEYGYGGDHDHGVGMNRSPSSRANTGVLMEFVALVLAVLGAIDILWGNGDNDSS